jgi:hypothetical protein
MCLLTSGFTPVLERYIRTMEQTSTQPEFASERRAALWLVGEFIQVVAVGFAVVLSLVGRVNLGMLGFFSLMGLSIWISVANQPPYPVGPWKARAALFRAASHRLGWKISLIWVHTTLTIVLFIAFVISINRPE